MHLTLLVWLKKKVAKPVFESRCKDEKQCPQCPVYLGSLEHILLGYHVPSIEKNVMGSSVQGGCFENPSLHLCECITAIGSKVRKHRVRYMECHLSDCMAATYMQTTYISMYQRTYRKDFPKWRKMCISFHPVIEH